ncbi:MAG: hypothetical protein HGA33_00520 [Candidatus Moranbacteria bacterium]|nr:hypothetical protein [Candidatus Moranbacteria bacterium]
MYSETLSKSGLSPAQAEVYEALLTHGVQPAGSLSKKTSLKRGLVYKVLEDLIDLGLAGKEDEEGKVARFFPKHPSVLRDVVENRRKSLKDAELSLDAVLPSLISNFNMVSGAPGVEIYEGPEGIEKVLNDSLTSKTVIYTYVDVESLVKHIDAINRRYANRRDKLGIEKRAILPDTAYAREYLKDYHRQVTDVKLISAAKAAPFQSALEIYDGKVAYITFTESKMIGVIIHDPSLYLLHKYVFEALWGMTPAYGVPAAATESARTSDAVEREGEESAESASAPKPFEEGKYDDDEYFVRL